MKFKKSICSLCEAQVTNMRYEKKFPSSGSRASLMAQVVKNPPAIQETWVQSLSWEDPLEEGMATHSSILAWRILWTEESGELWFMGSQKAGRE